MTVPISVTIPVNILEARVDFEAVAAKHARVGKPPAAVRGGKIGEADIAERGLAGADQDRGAIEQEAVDQILAEEGGGGFGTAFDEEVVDALQIRDIGRAHEI